MPEGSPQGLGSPLVETMQQACRFAMKGKLEQPAQIEVITLDNPQANAAVSRSHHASLIKREYDRLSLEHQQGAAI
eukprot:11353903-Karenia_brevis.AAC.1